MDTFELDGKTYVAEDARGRACIQCALFTLDAGVCSDHPCYQREDGREKIIWIEEADDGAIHAERDE